MSKKITESLGTAHSKTPGRVQVTLITPGRGSSGYYSAEVLEQAAKDKAFGMGTQMHINHNSPTDDFERPEGDLRNLAGVLMEDARWDGEALVAEARIGSAWTDFIEEFGEFIGVSISAQAEVAENGDITRFIPSPFNRADFVTVAGRGGEVTEILEAAKVIESRSIIAKETTERDVGMWLSATLRDQLDRWVHVLDHDTQYVYYETYEDDDRDRLYRRSYTLNGSTITLADDQVEVRRRTEYDPVQVSQPEPAGLPQSTPDQQEASMAQIDEKELQALQEKARRSDELAAENKELKEAQATQAAEARREKALAAVTNAFGEDAPAFFVTAAETAAQSEDYDHDSFKAQVDEAAKHKAQEAGTPNLGGGTGTVTETKTSVTADDIVAALEGRA